MIPRVRLVLSAFMFLVASGLALGPKAASAEPFTPFQEGLCDEGPFSGGTAHEFDPPWPGGACYKSEPGSYHQGTLWGYCHENHTRCNVE